MRKACTRLKTAKFTLREIQEFSLIAKNSTFKPLSGSYTLEDAAYYKQICIIYYILQIYIYYTHTHTHIYIYIYI